MNAKSLDFDDYTSISSESYIDLTELMRGIDVFHV